MPRVCVIQVNVTDMERAIEFYCDTIGFEVSSKEYYPAIVSLKHEPIPFILNLVEKPVEIDYPRQAQSLLNIQTESLATAMEVLKAKGVEFVHDTPQPCPVGVYAAFRDPFGNVHELLEFRDTA